MHNLEWNATKKKYRECTSYADAATLTSNEGAYLSSLTHFVRPNCLRLEWLGVPLAKREGAGKLEHRILLAVDGVVTVADRMADGSWYQVKAKTIFVALREIGANPRQVPDEDKKSYDTDAWQRYCCCKK